MDAPEVEETPEERAAYLATRAAGCTCEPAIYDDVNGAAVEHFKEIQTVFVEHFKTCALYRVEMVKAFAAALGLSVEEYLASIPVAEDPIEDARREAEEL